MTVKQSIGLKQTLIDVVNVRETVPYTLLSGGLAILNAHLFSTMPVLAFCVGAFLGAIVYLRAWKVPRSRGALLLVTTGVWVFLFNSAGVVDLLLKAI